MAEDSRNRIVEKVDSFIPRPSNKPMFQLIPIGMAGLLCGFVGWRLGVQDPRMSEGAWYVVYFMTALLIAYTTHWVIYMMVIQAHYRKLMRFAERLSDLSTRYQLTFEAEDSDRETDKRSTQPPTSRALH